MRQVHANFKEITQEAWCQSQQINIRSKMNNYKKIITKWGKQNFGNIQKEFIFMRNMLPQIQSSHYSKTEKK